MKKLMNYKFITAAATAAAAFTGITAYAQTPTHVRIAVHDDGPGIAQERLADLWERYYKVQEYHKRAIIGSGLGLAIVKQIVVLHHGTYGVSSTVGAGSIFWFELPRTTRAED